MAAIQCVLYTYSYLLTYTDRTRPDRGHRGRPTCWRPAPTQRTLSGRAKSGRVRLVEFALNHSQYHDRSVRSVSWWLSTVVERRSLTGELSLSCARPAADE